MKTDCLSEILERLEQCQLQHIFENRTFRSESIVMPN
jgi:hypothetical protein